MDRFYLADQTEAPRVAGLLLDQNYEELEATVINDNDERLMLLIDKHSNTFFFLDEGALKRAEMIIKGILKDNINPIKTSEVELWKM